MDSDAPLSAYLKKATEEYSLCPNRVWAVAGSLLPMLIPTNNPNRPCNHGDELPNHEMCTFEFCEYSQRDFTAINQRHECRDKKCERLQGLFSRQVLEQAATADESTVWRLDGHSTISRLQPYMAVSHVWSDGTGAGKWLDGEVNECLYNFFRRIAVQFQCDGIWWDTLCIPQEKAARTKAIKKIQSNYENARITLVHDCFLRNWTWDPETACFAILMSPWFSRGWTALELQRSRKVKVVFKGSCGLVIKDLDEEILVEEGDGPRREASDKIRSLRKEITTLNDLLTVIKPRYTSWPKDVSIISGLLTDVELSSDAHKDIWQQDVYKRIVTKIGKVSFDHLFHNSPTMSKVGWCPPSIYDMPVADNNAKALLKVTPELHLDGTLRRIPLDAVHDDRYNWRGVHPLIREHLKLYLRKEKGACFLLIEPLSESNPKGVERAILGKERESQIDGKPCYEFVGAVYFQPGLEIGDLVKRGDLDQNRVPLILLGDANGSMAETGEQAQPQSHSQQAVPENELHDAIWRGVPRRFSIDLEEVLAPDSHGQQPLHLAAERGDVKMVLKLLEKAEEKNLTKEVLTAKCDNKQTPLHRASWAGSARVVKLLLDRAAKANHRDQNGNTSFNIAAEQDNEGNTALHIAAEKGFKPVVDLLIPESECLAKNNNAVSPLHFAAWSGEMNIVEALYNQGTYSNAKDKHGWTPLHYAASNGQSSIVSWLLGQGVNPDPTDKKVGWTPLYFAAMNGHEAVVKELVQNSKESVFQADKLCWMPQRFAELKEHSEALKALSDKDTSISDKNNGATGTDDRVPNKNDSASSRDDSVSHKDDGVEILHRWTPLHCLAINEQQVSPKQLLDKDADPVLENNELFLQMAARQGLKAVVKVLLLPPVTFKLEDGIKAIWEATENGHAAILRLLFETFKVNVEFGNRNDHTALLCAAMKGHEAVVRLLVENFNADVESKGEDGRTALSWAAGNGHETVSRLLVEIYMVDVMSSDESGRTALSWAAGNGSKAVVVELLLNSGKVKNGDITDNVGKTALSWAAAKGYEAVVSVLLKSEKVNDVCTALPEAAKFRHKGVVKLLLESDKIKDDPEGVDCCWRALSQAAEKGYKAVVKLLLDSDKIKFPNRGGHGGQQALLYASCNKHKTVVKLLLNSDKIRDVDTKNEVGRTALSYAAEKENKAVMKRLLNSDKVNDVCTALPWAAKGIVKLLLNSDKLRDGDRKGKDGRTALSWAVGKGYEVVVKRLLNSDKVRDGDSKDRKCRTALWWAAEMGYGVIVKLLLNSVKVQDGDAEDRDGRTALSRASRNGNQTVVERLLNSEKVEDGDVKDKGGRTALWWAVRNKHETVVELLLNSKKVKDRDAKDKYGRTALS